MSRKPSLLELYSRLPKKNCGECGFSTCMAFAAAILEGKSKLDDCPYITEEERRKVEDLITAPVVKLTFGKRKPLSIGEARVLHRHELKFYSPTALAVEITDTSEDKVVSSVRNALNIKVNRLGETFGIDTIAVTSSTNKPEIFSRAIKQISEITELPIILHCWDPTTLKIGLDTCSDEKPLVLGANKDNFNSYLDLAEKYKVPLVIAEKELSELRLMAKKAIDKGIEIALYPVARTIQEAIRNNIMIRRAAIEKKISELGRPIIEIPHVLITKSNIQNEPFWSEAMNASALIFRYADLLILKNISIETLCPLITLRHGVFSDPKIPAKVKTGLHKLGSPDPESPVLLTVNYALTFYLVSGDIDKSRINCYLLVVDTEGMSVLNALAGNQLKPKLIADLIQQTDLNSTVNHRKLIIPGLAGRLRSDLEELTGWEIIVGPSESRDISHFLRKNWIDINDN